ncbi:hypothetical protein BC830DRAFT_1154342, partial [Chytriomyces sp. MP71]
MEQHTISQTHQRQQQQVTIGTVTGKQFQVTIRPTDTVRDVKIRIEEEEAIPLEQQILMFGEKTLKDGSAIRDLGIKSGSRLQLGVHMSSGPGPITRIRKQRKDDSVVVVLSKQRNGLYMLEFHVKDGDATDKREAANQLYKLAQELPPFLLSELAGADDGTNDEDGEELQSEDNEEYEQDTSDDNYAFEDDEDPEYREDHSGIESREESACSSLSTSAFLSLLATPESSISEPLSRLATTAPSSARTSHTARSKDLSSKSKEIASRDCAGQSSSSLINKDGKPKRSTSSSGLKRSFPKSAELKTSSKKLDVSVVLKKKIRPATAISIMRLPDGACPNITIVRSRPSTAAVMKQTSVDSVNSDVTLDLETLPRTQTALSVTSRCTREAHSLSTSKSVRFSHEMAPHTSLSKKASSPKEKGTSSKEQHSATLSSREQHSRNSKGPRVTPPRHDLMASRGKLAAVSKKTD